MTHVIPANFDRVITMTILRSALLLAIVFAAVSSAGSQSTTSLVDNRTGAVTEEASFFVAVEGDGKYLDKPHPESGRMARHSMFAA